MIDRQDLFRTSFNAVMTTPIPELKKLPNIKFDNETGLDYGGLRREWFYLLSHEVFNPYYGLFEYASDNIYTLQMNANSGINPEHLQYFEFVGRIIAMAIRNHHQLDAFFIRPIYKLMLGNEHMSIDDMALVDAEYHKNLEYVLNSDDIEGLELCFEMDDERFGEVTTTELKPGGATIAVTNENKVEYVNLLCKRRFVDKTRDQLASLMKGNPTMFCYSNSRGNTDWVRGASLFPPLYGRDEVPRSVSLSLSLVTMTHQYDSSL